MATNRSVKIRVKFLFVTACLGCFAATWRTGAANAAKISGAAHLRSGDAPEWDAFARARPDGRRLDVDFTAQSNRTAATLFIHQSDVRQDWFVEINKQRVGKLFTMESDLVQSLSIPPGVLRNGSNHLAIVPPSVTDDILIQSIVLDARPVVEATAEGALRVHASSEGGEAGIPCRITILNSDQALAPLVVLTNGLGAARSEPGDSFIQRGLLAARPGVVYTGNGDAVIGLRAGSYTVFASRGFEWSVATAKVEVQAGSKSSIAVTLRREVDTRGWVSCDTHVHTFTHSGHGDCTTEERMLTLAGEGIELPVATDHNLQVDYTDTARATHTEKYFTPIIGNEVTTSAGHFNIFPVKLDARSPDFRITDWPTLMKTLRGTPDVRVVILNHPRNVHNSFQPFAATNYNAVSGVNLRGPEFSFDAMEVLNSSAQQTDYMLVYRDWFALLNHGYRTTGVGSSDCHDVSRYIVGQGRTYIRVEDSDPRRINIAAACSNLLGGHALVSMGLLPEMRIADRFEAGDMATGLTGNIPVEVRVLGPSWVTATNVTLFANGIPVRNEVLAPSRAGGVKGIASWSLPRPPHDVHLVAIATGPAVDLAFWAIPKPYQPSSSSWTGRVIGSTNPIWVDADGDGRFTPPREYARIAVNKSGEDPEALVAALSSFDEAVAAQAASLWAGSGRSLDELRLKTALQTAAPAVQRGFTAFAASLLTTKK